MDFAYRMNSELLSDGRIKVEVPNVLLTQEEAILMYVYSYEDNTTGAIEKGRTEYINRFPVKQRVKPEDYIYVNNVELVSLLALRQRLLNLEETIKAAEINRASAESNRQSAEQERVTNENQRITDSENLKRDSQELMKKHQAALDEVPKITEKAKQYAEEAKAQKDVVVNSAAEKISEIENTASEQIKNISTKGVETLDSIPDDYSSAIADINTLKEDLDALKTDSKINLFPDKKKWEKGNIDSATGVDIVGTSSNSRAKGFVDVESGVYSISNYDNSNFELYVFVYSGETFKNRITCSFTGSNHMFITLPTDATRIRYSIYKSGMGTDIFVPRLQFEKGTAPTQYVGSEVLNIAEIDNKSINLQKLSNDLFERSGINLYPENIEWEKGTYSTTDGSKTSNNNSRTINKIPISKCGIYSLTYNGTESFEFYIYTYSSDSYIGKLSFNVNGSCDLKVQINDDVKFVTFSIYKGGYASDKVFVPIMQFELGEKNSEYERPYVLSSTIIGKTTERRLSQNLKDKIDSFSKSRINLLSDIAWIKGGIDASSGAENTNAYCVRLLKRIPCSYHYKYVYTIKIGATISSCYFYFYDDNDVYLGRREINFLKSGSYTITPYEGATTFKMCIYDGSLDKRQVFVESEMQLEVGENSTTMRSQKYIVDKNHIESISPDQITQNFEVPEYYLENGYLQGKVNRIKELAKTCCANGDLFFFITDMHETLNQLKSYSLIEYISNRVNIQRLFNGGDLADGGSYTVANNIRKCFDGEIHTIIGNHEYMGGRKDSELYYMLDMYGKNQIGNPKRHYYYVNNEQQKIRYVCLCSNAESPESSPNNPTVAPENEQISWFRDVALDVQEGWSVIVFIHVLCVLNSSDEIDVRGASKPIQDVIDAYDGNGKIICIIQGDAHKDRISSTPGGVPIIITACDKNIGYSDYEKSLLAYRVSETTQEQLFDVVCIDKTNREIHLVRIGGQARDGIGNNIGDFVEERTVTY